MTWAHSGEAAAASINEVVPGAAVEYNQTDVWVLPEHILDVARHLKDAEGLDFSYLNAVSAVDYVEYFEMVVPSAIAEAKQQPCRKVKSDRKR